jgi:hypothetical protein
MPALQHPSAAPPPEARSSAGLDLAPLAHGAPEQADAGPLLVLDAGAFLARCRWCGWTSPPDGSSPGAALAAFKAHAYKERPA